MEKQKIEFSWEDTGKLDIEVVGNLSATLRYRPSDKFVAETLAKFRKGTASNSKTHKQTKTKAKHKIPSRQKKRLSAGVLNGGNMAKSTENVNGTYGLFSKGLQQAYKKGDWSKASEILRLMGMVLETEEKYTDELKVLMLSFYFDLSGKQIQPFTNKDTVSRIRKAYQKSGLNETKVSELYFDVIRDDTMLGHSMTVSGSFRLFMYCLLGKEQKNEDILENLRK